MEVGEGAGSERVQHSLGGARGVQQLDDLVGPAEHLHAEKRQRHLDEYPSTVQLDAAVDPVTDEQRADECRAGIDDDEQTDEQERPPEPFEQTAEARLSVVGDCVSQIDVGVTT